MAFSSELRLSSALRVLISEGQNHLVGVEDWFPATGSLLREQSKRGKGILAEERVFHTSPNMKVSPTVEQLLLTVVVGCFYRLMLFKPLATGVTA